jgi:hypothetical protein
VTADTLVRSLHRALADALRRRGHPLDQPVTVLEIHEELVPYRTVRSVLDVHLRADYEHALLRLLAGEEDRVKLEPAEARDELRAELQKPYPEVSRYRKFAASRVFVSDAQADDSDERSELAGAGGGEPAAGPEPVSDPPPSAPTWSGTGEPDPRPGPAASPASDARPGDDARPGADDACVFCGAELPAGKRPRFCPQCGGDQRMAPCGRCGEPLDPRWRFCIACGQEVGAD